MKYLGGFHVCRTVLTRTVSFMLVSFFRLAPAVCRTVGRGQSEATQLLTTMENDSRKNCSTAELKPTQLAVLAKKLAISPENL